MKTRFSKILVCVGAVLLATACTTLTKKELATEYHAVAEDFFALGDYERAQKYFEKALEFSRYPNKSLFNLARSYLETDNFSAAEGILDDLLAQDPDNLLVKELQAYLFHRTGRSEEALALYEDLLEVFQDLRIVKNAAKLYMETEGAAETVDLVAELVDQHEDDAELLALYLQALLATGDTEAADLYAEDYLGLVEEDEEVLADIALSFESAGLFEDAVEAYTRLAELTPEWGDILFARARIRIVEGIDALKGVEELRQALEQGYRDEGALAALLSEQSNVSAQTLSDLYDDFEIVISEQNDVSDEDFVGDENDEGSLSESQ